MEIKTEEYNICYESETVTVEFTGSLRLSGMEEYKPIVELLNQMAESEPPQITLNLRQLQFLNSSGISMLSRFVIKVRQQKNVTMLVLGSKNIPWQGRSLKNLERLMPNLTLDWE